MKNLQYGCKAWLLMLCILLSSFSFAQNIAVSGRVLSSNQSPLAGATISVKGAQTSTTTNNDGVFHINVTGQNAILVISFVGYSSEEIPLAGKTDITVTMTEFAGSLDDVVVVGYGTQRRKNVTAALSNFDASKLDERPVQRLDQALVGQLAGVTVKQTTGSLGQGISIQVRGVGSITAGSEPLYVIDGFPLATAAPNGSGNYGLGNPLDNINPNDVESIQVLKDAAAAAIYGSRAANGVVLITTKKGKVGKPKIDLNTYVGYMERSRKLDMLSPEEWVDRAKEIINAQWEASGAGRTSSQTNEQRRVILGLTPGNVNTSFMYDDRWDMPGHPGLNYIDWQDEAFRKGMLNNIQLSASGGNENLRELILSAQFTTDLTASGQNTQHLYYVSRYEDIQQMQRDLSGDRPFSRLSPTYYMYRIYDMVNDSRFWKTFRTKHRVNSNAPTAPYVVGDLGLMYVINQPGDTRFSAVLLNNSVVYSGTGKTIPHVYVAYPNGRTTDGALLADSRRFPSLSKFMDGSRTAGFNDVRGLRDITLARSAETYLIAAEAKIRLAKAGTGSYNDALPYINPLRARAQYTGGESRSVYYDGGAAPSSAPQTVPASFFPENSYYESNNIPVTTAASAGLAVTDIAGLPAGDENIISRLGYSSPYDRMLCFLLNERARELAGEYLRWQDLSRTKTLAARAKEFNPDAAPNIQDRHLLRPIPQTFLDGIQANGVGLTAAEKQAMQNPGY